MATAAQPKTRPTEADQRLLLRGVGWDAYLRALDIVDNRGARLAYDQGDLEFMSPSPEHERLGYLLGKFVDILSEELEIPVYDLGSTTFRRQDLDRGIEPDACFYIANADRVRDKPRLDLSIDPPPDLAIEVDVTSSSLDRMGIYAALGVPELWRFDGEVLRIYGLGPERNYREEGASRSFPGLPVAGLPELIDQAFGRSNLEWRRLVQDWIRRNYRQAGP